jgi:predicted esterase
MSMSFSRALRRIGVVCSVAGVLLATSLASRASVSAETLGSESSAHRAAPVAHTVASQITTLGGDDTRGVYTSKPVTLRTESGSLMAFPPAKSAARRPMSVIYLHGAHARVANGCPWFRSGASELGWLVCPEGVEAQPDGSWSWGADVFAQSAVVSRALRAAAANGASTEPGVAVGFSQGSYVAVDLIKTHQARFRGLVLLGADMHPNVQTLKDAGVVRVAIGAGALDGAHDSLVVEARRLQSEGLETRFVDLGHIGHAYTVADTAVLRDAIAWAGGLDG